MTYEELLRVLSNASEFEELPVRHNEDNLNESLSRDLRQAASRRLGKNVDAIERPDYASPHTKAALLFQAHFARFAADQLPIADYVTDLKSVLDQSIRILQAMVDTSAEDLNALAATIKCIELMQCVKSGCWWNENTLLASGVVENAVQLSKSAVKSLPELLMECRRSQ